MESEGVDVDSIPSVKCVVQFLENLAAKVVTFPKKHQSPRFGDPNFRVWHGYLCSITPGLSFEFEENITLVTLLSQSSFKLYHLYPVLIW